MIAFEDEDLLIASEIQPVKQFLVSALNLKLKGSTNHYNHIVSNIQTKQDAEMLWRLFIALSSNVSILTKKPDSYRDLIQAIYSYNWQCGDKVTVALLNLIGIMVSSNVTFLVPAFQFLVNGLMTSPNQNQNDPTLYEDEKKLHLKRVHRSIKHLLTVVPTGQSELFPILGSHFPHKRFELNVLRSYATEILCIAEYFPGIQESILDLILTKCLEIDVDIVIEETGEVKINEEVFENSDSENIFSLDDSETPKMSGFRYLSSETHKISNEVAQSADKLDVLLILVVEFLTLQVDKHKTEINNYVFRYILNIFEENILSTHRSKFVQFVLFFLAGYTNHEAQRFDEFFLNRLIRIFLNNSSSNVKKQSSLMYFASFASRANFLSMRMISTYYLELLHWAYDYVVDASQPSSPRLSLQGQVLTESYREVDELGRLTAPATALQKHETFYLCIQALCYITCFHGIDLVVLLQTSKNFQTEWNEILTSSLRPIAYCLLSIKQEFLKFIRTVNLIDQETLSKISTVEEQNDAGSNNGNTENVNLINSIEQNSLDVFFPYDPCLLLSLNQHIEKYYRAWKGSPGGNNSSITDQPTDILSNNDGDDILSEGDGSSQTSYSCESGLSYLRKECASSSIMSVAVSLYNKSEPGMSMASSSPAHHHMEEHLMSNPKSMSDTPSSFDMPIRRPRQYSIGSTGSW